MVILRDYQQDLYDKIIASARKGSKRILAVAPCGAGKSYIIAKLASETGHGVLILTHRKELLEQTGALVGSSARMAMVMTEANHLGEYPTPRLIIADEAHLSRAKSWVKVLEYYGSYTIGFTATPIRLDGKPLGDVYDDIVEGVDARWLIDHQRLAPYDYYSVPVVDTDNLRSRMGDFVIEDLEDLMTNRAIYSDVLRTWEEIAKNEKTIAYCVSVKHAKETADMFTAAGYKAVELDGTTPSEERKHIMDDFRNGKFQILCNVGIISEGVSIDDVTCCLLLRPTESLALFWQQGMRCMRYLPEKRAKIIDCVANYTRNPLFDMPVEWSLNKKLTKRKLFNESGDFTLRTCPECYQVFQTANVCPYCGHIYEPDPRELKKREEIRIEKITAEEAEKAEKVRKQMRMEVGRCRSVEDLWKVARERGYSNGWVWHMAKAKGIRM